MSGSASGCYKVPILLDVCGMDVSYGSIQRTLKRLAFIFFCYHDAITSGHFVNTYSFYRLPMKAES